MPSDFYLANMEIFKSRFPHLCEKICNADSGKIAVAKAEDGGIFYASMTPAGKWEALSNPKDPIRNEQAAVLKMEKRLTGGLAPAVIVGLNPGYALEIVFNLFSEMAEKGDPFRNIYVIADSIECFTAWLKAADRASILSRKEISFHLRGDVNEIVSLCEEDESRSHMFIPISSLPENVMNSIIEPLAQLYLRREAEAKRLHDENNAYYNELDDAALADVISGKANRKPRILLPVHASSTVVQYSARDASAEFEKQGWQVRILRMETDFTKWMISKAVSEFKPDILLFINHLRIEDRDFYPENLLFITWLQDTVQYINHASTAEEWNRIATGRKRDMIMGYVDQIRKYGYPAERLFPSGMIVNPEIFNPETGITPEQHAKYDCDVCFASNRGITTEQIVEEELLPYLADFGFTREMLGEIHDSMWKKYRSGETITSYDELKAFLLSLQKTEAAVRDIPHASVDNVIQTIFWKLNDTVYRYVVLEWLDELGIKMNLYGANWKHHPRFAKYDKGQLPHGKELAIAYRCAKRCLHLNSQEGMHQRLFEITASGAIPLTRVTNPAADKSRQILDRARLRLCMHLEGSGPEFSLDMLDDEKQKEALGSWLFDIAFGIACAYWQKERKNADVGMVESELIRTAANSYGISIDSVLSLFDNASFADKISLSKITACLNEEKTHQMPGTAFHHNSICMTIEGASLELLGRSYPAKMNNLKKQIFSNAASLGCKYAGLTHESGDVKDMAILLNALHIHPEKQVDIASSLCMKGVFDVAAIIINRTAIVSDITPELLDKIATAYLRMSDLKNADRILNYAQDHKKCTATGKTLRSVWNWCSWRHDDALKELHPEINPVEYPSKLMMLNFAGRFAEAIECAEAAIDSRTSIADYVMCQCFSEKGNALRELGRIDEALAAYPKGLKICPHWLPTWSWIIYFEYAMTLFNAGRVDEALEVAEEGYRYSSPIVDDACNPCLFLRRFILHRKGIKEAGNPDEWLKDIGKWPEPFLYYKALMFFFSAVICHENSKNKLSESFIKALADDPILLEPQGKRSIFELFRNYRENSMGKDFASGLASLLRPAHGKDSFMHKFLISCAGGN